MDLFIQESSKHQQKEAQAHTNTQTCIYIFTRHTHMYAQVFTNICAYTYKYLFTHYIFKYISLAVLFFQTSSGVQLGKKNHSMLPCLE